MYIFIFGFLDKLFGMNVLGESHGRSEKQGGGSLYRLAVFNFKGILSVDVMIS